MSEFTDLQRLELRYRITEMTIFIYTFESLIKALKNYAICDAKTNNLKITNINKSDPPNLKYQYYLLNKNVLSSEDITKISSLAEFRNNIAHRTFNLLNDLVEWSNNHSIYDFENMEILHNLDEKIRKSLGTKFPEQGNLKFYNVGRDLSDIDIIMQLKYELSILKERLCAIYLKNRENEIL